MSGGVDSSVAAALLRQRGHDVVGATLKLWGGASDSGCCSVADVDDARRVARQLGIDHHVFNYVDVFGEQVVEPYVAAHARGETPNPCIECNRHVKFGVLLARAGRLGFDALATGHHARVGEHRGAPCLRRGVDRAKDQSYVLSMLSAAQLASVLLPVGDLTKHEVRAEASRLGLSTATKPDSQDVCFIQSRPGRAGFLVERVPLHPAAVVDAASGRQVGTVPAVELVTVGQRRGLGVSVDGRRRFALAVDVARRQVVVGDTAAARSPALALTGWAWSHEAPEPGTRLLAQVSAHGPALGAVLGEDGIEFDEPQRLVAPGQTVALFDATDPEAVVGSAIAAPAPPAGARGLPAATAS